MSHVMAFFIAPHVINYSRGCVLFFFIVTFCSLFYFTRERSLARQGPRFGDAADMGAGRL